MILIGAKLKAPAGLLGGLGRRVSSLLWGSLAAPQGGECKLVRVVASRKSHPTAEDASPPRTALVLTSSGLQKWRLEAGEPERLAYEADLVAAGNASFFFFIMGGVEGGGIRTRVS
jgi:hypothetical protein